MRTAFINQLIEEAKGNENIFLLVGDLGFSVVEPFAKLFPERYLNVGIAEQNMAGIAAGLAMEGYCVYIYSIGNFPTLRCMEQIRYDICYHNLNVKIVAVGGGYAYGALGPSHHATEDIGMLRTIPNMVVCSPSDPIEAKAITSISVNYNGPMYLRLGKAGEKIIHRSKNLRISIGDIIKYKEQDNSDTAILVTGSIADYAINYVNEKKLRWNIYTLPFIKPINKEQLKDIVTRHNELIVLEEHQKSCGVGSAVIEILNDLFNIGEIENYPKIRRIAIDDRFYSIAGDQSFLRELANLSLNKDNIF